MVLSREGAMSATKSDMRKEGGRERESSVVTYDRAEKERGRGLLSVCACCDRGSG